MQQLKPLAELLHPDPTNTMFGKLGAETGSIGLVALEDIYEIVSRISTAESVPEDVRSYFKSIKNLAVFGPRITGSLGTRTTCRSMP